MVFFGRVGLYGVILYHLIIRTQQYNTSTLKLVNVVFRHGSRTSAERNTYPKDPYINETYYPYGLDQLTNKGKVQMFQTGKVLRKRYDSFLGDLYTPDILYGISAPNSRNEMSLQLVFAGLFPSNRTLLMWNHFLNWQPIPYDVPKCSYLLFGIGLWSCSKYMAIYQKFMMSEAGYESLNPYRKLFNYLSYHTGFSIDSNLNLLGIYNTLNLQSDWGFKLPSWTNSIYPERLGEGTGRFFIQLTSTPELRRMSGGFLLKNIIDDSRAKMLGTLSAQKRKLYFYSGHDLTIGNFLGVMGMMHPEQVPFGACLLIELHQINKEYGFKIFYYKKYISSEPSWLTIPGCGKFCPIDKFLELFGTYLPDKNSTC